MTGIYWAGSAGKLSACPGWRGARIISCGCMTALRRPGIRDTRRRCMWIIRFRFGRSGDSIMELTGKELLAMRLVDEVFQREVLDKLARLETKMDTLVGNGQLGRVKASENKIEALEKSEMR